MNEHEASDNNTVIAYKLDKTNTQKDGTEEYDLVNKKPMVLQINKLSHIHIQL
jgi:hypothetical protein